MKFLPFVIALAVPAFGLQEELVQIGGIRLTPPEGWTRSDPPDKTIVFAAPGVGAGQKCTVTILPAEEYAGSGEEWHNALWQALTGSFKIVGVPKAETVGSFRRTWAELVDPSGSHGWFALYTGLSGRRASGLVFAVNRQALWKDHEATVRAMMKKAQLGEGQAPAERRDTIGALTVKVPEGWTKTVQPDGGTALRSPDSSDRGACQVVFYAVQPTEKTAKEAHDAVWARLLALGEAVKEESGKTGGFLWTATEIRNAQGRGWFRLYSTVDASRYVGVLFASDTEALATKHLPTVAAMLETAMLKAEAGKPEGPLGAGKRLTVGPLELTLLEGWTAKEDAKSGWTMILPPGISNPVDVCAYIRPGMPFEGTWWASHRKCWAAIAASSGMKDLDPPTSIADAPGEFIEMIGRWKLNDELAPKVALYTARSGDTLVAVFYSGNNYGDFSLHQWALHRILSGAVIKDAPARKNTKIAEAFHCPRAMIVTNADGSNSSYVKDDRLLLYENGVADFRAYTNEGYDGFPYWKVDPDLSNSSFGQWKAIDKEVQVKRGQQTESYRREGGNLRLGKEVWEPMLRVDGLKPKGRFSRRSGPNDTIPFYDWIEFTPEGRFSMSGILQIRINDSGNLEKVPDKGAGRYEIRNWTLHLMLDNGFAQDQDFFVRDGDVKNPDEIWLLQKIYKREK